MYILNFNRQKQVFEFDSHLINELEYRDKQSGLNFRTIARNFIFTEPQKKSNYYIFKNFLEPETAKELRTYYTNTEMRENFYDTGDSGNFRFFYYLNSPFKYPKFIKSLILKLMEFKNMIYENHDFYQNYCMIEKLNPMKYDEVARRQSLHSWQTMYWYRHGCNFPQHIDGPGELACFLILSKKGVDYHEGGMELTYDDGTRKRLDDEYDYGDLVFLDQAEVYHEVKEIKHDHNQIGRLQFYIPTPPPFYMKRVLFFEGFEHTPFFASDKEDVFFRIYSKYRSYFKKENIHYSRRQYNHASSDL